MRQIKCACPLHALIRMEAQHTCRGANPALNHYLYSTSHSELIPLLLGLEEKMDKHDMSIAQQVTAMSTV